MNKEEVLISVIVPIYKVEKYLNKCIDSIVNQTYNNLEIILVDDGSPDNCPRMCDEWAKKDSRIKVIHKQNGGLSDARNIGIDKSNGDYIAFVDSDDYVDSKMYETLLKNLLKTNSDISVCNLVEVLEDEELVIKSKGKILIEEIKEMDKFNNLYNEKVQCTEVAWNKLYKKDLFKNLRYPKGRINEDTFTTHYLLDNASKIVYTNEKLYYYVQREDSIMHTFNIKRLDVVDALMDRMIFFSQDRFNNTKCRNMSIENFLDIVITYYLILKYNEKNIYNKTYVAMLRKKFNKNYQKALMTNITKKKQFKYICFRFFPNLLYLFNKKRIISMAS